MREGPFREDENELPYLVSQKRDSYYRKDENEYFRDDYGQRSVPFELHFKGISFKEFPSYVMRLNLSRNHKDNIIRSVDIKPGNCTFSLNQIGDDVRMSFKVENEYLSTELNFRYDCVSGCFEYIGGYTHHDGLESQQWFRDEVRRIENETGYSYEFCYNGHDFSTKDGRVVINDAYESMVMFEEDHDSDHYGYKVDFTRKMLEEYQTYPFHEYFLFF